MSLADKMMTNEFLSPFSPENVRLVDEITGFD